MCEHKEEARNDKGRGKSRERVSGRGGRDPVEKVGGWKCRGALASYPMRLECLSRSWSVSSSASRIKRRD